MSAKRSRPVTRTASPERADASHLIGSGIVTPTDGISSLERALGVAAMGWPVFPVRDKRPLVLWGTAATTDAEQIATWWGSEFPDAAVGVHTGQAGLNVVDVDEKGGVSGSANLAAAGYMLPKTVSYATPSGGRHHLYRAPEDEALTIAQGVPVQGVDIRGGNGFIVYYGKPPKPGKKLAQAPSWSLVRRGEPSSAARGGFGAFIQADETSLAKPGRKLLKRLLAKEGIGHGEMLADLVAIRDLDRGWAEAIDAYRAHYCRGPWNGREWERAFDVAVDGLDAPRPPLTTIERPERVEDVDDLYVDVAAVLAGGMAPIEPDAGGIKLDGTRLLYRGKVNGIVGESGVGKTIIAACMAADELLHDGSVLWVDCDHNGAEGTLKRLLWAGIGEDVLLDPARFRLAIPEDRKQIAEVVDDSASWSPTMAVIDSVGEVMPMLGGNSNDADDYTRVHREVFAELAKSGAAVLVIDHAAKTSLDSGYASGSGAKKRALDGSYFQARSVEGFKPGVGGAAALVVLKDRFGGVIAGAEGTTAAIFRLDSRADAWTWEFYRARTATERATSQAEEDAAFVKSLDSMPSRRELMDLTRERFGKGWGSDRANAALQLAKSTLTTILSGPEWSGTSPGPGSEVVRLVPWSIDQDQDHRTGPRAKAGAE